MPDLIFASKGTAEVLRAQTLVNEKAAELKQIYNDDARAARDLEAAAGRIFKNAMNPAKQFNEEMGKLLGNFKQGKINAEQYEKGVKKLEAAYAQANTLGGKLKSTIGGMFGPQQLQMLRSFALGMTGAGGITAALALLRSEYQATQALIDKANRTQLDVGSSRKMVIRNLVGSSDDAIRAVLAQSRGLADELKLPETIVNQSLVDAMSASSNNVPLAMSAVRLAGRFLPDAPDQIGEFAGSLLDMQKVTGSADANVNFGLLAQISQLSRVTSPKRIALNAPKGLVGDASYGATGQEAAALYSTLTFAAKDPLGAATATAQVQLSKQLFEFGGDGSEHNKKAAAAQKKVADAEKRLADAQEKLADHKARRAEASREQVAEAKQALDRAEEDLRLAKAGGKSTRTAQRRVDDARDRLNDARVGAAALDPTTKGMEKSIADQQSRLAELRTAATAGEDPRLAQYRKLTTRGQRLAFLQANPDLARTFFDNASFEAQLSGPIRDLLLNPQSEAAKSLRDNMAQIPDNAGLAGLAEKSIGQLALDPLEPLAQADRAFNNLRERQQLRRKLLLSTDQATMVREALQENGGTQIGSRARTFLGQLQDGEQGLSLEEARNILADERDRLNRGRAVTAPTLGPGGGGTTFLPATVEDKENAKLLTDVVDVLSQQLEAIKETNRRLSEGGIVAGGD